MNQVIFIPYNQALKERAQEMRKNPTPTELIMWERVLRKNKTGFRFLRQKPIDQFIVDFYCAELKLVVEIDGEIHSNQVEYDEARTDILEDKYGIYIARFKNEEILNNIKEVELELKKIIKLLASKIPPLDKEGGRGEI